jgi:hypothetical protein
MMTFNFLKEDKLFNIKNYLNLDKSRSSKFNLIKLLISDNSKFEEINNFILFGTFKQKLFHYLFRRY